MNKLASLASKISFSLLVILLGCSSEKKDVFEVNGTIRNWDEIAKQFPTVKAGNQLTLLLMEVPFGADMQPVQLDSVTITKNKPQFTLKAKFKYVGMYDVVVVGNGPVIPLVNDANLVNLNIDLLAPGRYYYVDGSAASKELQDFIYGYSEKGALTNKALNALDSLKQIQAPDSLLILATENKNKSIDALNDYLRSFFTTTTNGTVAAFALSRASQTLSQSDYEGLLNQTTRKFPQDIHLVDIQKQYKAYKNQLAEEERRRALNSWVGKKAPEFSMADSAGIPISLSSFKGRYVLVDFWASWCEPCRNENPNVVAAYRKFKGKNLAIWGVSLDKTREPWLKAIRDDKLQWQHSSDLSYWNSAAVKTFHFEEIPFNILINPEGMVIAERLKGEDLMKKLEEVLK